MSMVPERRDEDRQGATGRQSREGQEWRAAKKSPVVDSRGGVVFQRNQGGEGRTGRWSRKGVESAIRMGKIDEDTAGQIQSAWAEQSRTRNPVADIMRLRRNLFGKEESARQMDTMFSAAPQTAMEQFEMPEMQSQVAELDLDIDESGFDSPSVLTGREFAQTETSDPIFDLDLDDDISPTMDTPYSTPALPQQQFA